jgi:hypothetical protein
VFSAGTGAFSGSRPLGRTLLARLSLLIDDVASLLVLVPVLRAWPAPRDFEDEMRGRGRGRRGNRAGGKTRGAAALTPDTLLPVP